MELPPLNALKAFEAAARTGSFVLAARELGVSSAAVSLQVRNLEAFLNKRLFTRTNNKIALTDAGMAIYPGSAAALNGIAAITGRLLGRDGRARLVVSALPSLAERWLAPRLADFARAEPGVGMAVRVEDDPVDFVRHRIDLRVTYGGHLYPAYRAVHLFRDEVTPLHAPAYPARFEDQGGRLRVPDEHLIHVAWGEAFASEPSWDDWFRAANLPPRPATARGTHVASSSLAIVLAARGMGVALGQKRLAGAEIASGVLIAPSALTLKLAHPYCAVSPHAKSGDPHHARLLDWLTGAVERFDPDRAG